MTPQRTWAWPAKQREPWTGKNLRWNPNDWELWRESGVTPKREPFNLVRHHEETLQLYERIADTIRVLPYVAAAVEMVRTLELPPMEIGALTARTGTGVL